mmetsp:Transcript_29623/g.81389  ORF Transcript_29623/g.81389 Transcript_29623/m.81389 type:complete len:313 (+) Transcript_29623:1156-2094(+)
MGCGRSGEPDDSTIHTSSFWLTGWLSTMRMRKGVEPSAAWVRGGCESDSEQSGTVRSMRSAPPEESAGLSERTWEKEEKSLSEPHGLESTCQPCASLPGSRKSGTWSGKGVMTTTETPRKQSAFISSTFENIDDDCFAHASFIDGSSIAAVPTSSASCSTPGDAAPDVEPSQTPDGDQATEPSSSSSSPWVAASIASICWSESVSRSAPPSSMKLCCDRYCAMRARSSDAESSPAGAPPREKEPRTPADTRPLRPPSSSSSSDSSLICVGALPPSACACVAFHSASAPVGEVKWLQPSLFSSWAARLGSSRA